MVVVMTMMVMMRQSGWRARRGSGHCKLAELRLVLLASLTSRTKAATKVLIAKPRSLLLFHNDWAQDMMPLPNPKGVTRTC